MVKNRAKKILLFFLVAIFLEVVVCNFRTWESMRWKAYDLLDNNSFCFKDGQYKSLDADGNSIIAPFREDWWCDLATFEYEEGVKVQNIYLLCRYLDSQNNPIEKSYVRVNIKISDEGNKIKYQLPDRVIASKIKRTQYNRLNPSGKLKGLELTFLKPYENINAVEILECQFNRPVSLHFSVIRFVFLFIVIIFIYYLRPRTFIYDYKFGDNFSGKKETVILVIVVCVLFSLFFANINPQYNYKNYRTQYHELAEALLEGHAYLNEEPSAMIREMDNPYDTRLRDEVARETGENWRLDWAYFNGKYYVYFGIVPVLLNFLPYYALTEEHLPVTASVSFFGIFYIVGCFAYLWLLFKKYFSKVPFVMYIYSCCILLFCSGMFYAFRGPAFYGLPILSAAAFAVWGLWFWQSAQDNMEHCFHIKVMLGSFCIAVIAGCRPQFLVVSMLALFIFKDLIFDKTCLFSKRGYKFLGALIGPVILVAIFIMYYNYIRFGSFFDFGANYNLTSNDMTHRGWHWDRLMLGFFMYLFDPTKVSAVFPFILDSIFPSGNVIAYTNYMGITIVEGNFGGIVFNHPILILPFLIGVLKKNCEKYICRLSMFLVCSALLIVAVDTQMAGLVGRYLMDFGWLLCMAAILIFSSVEQNSSDITLKVFMRTGTIISTFGGVIYEFLLAFNACTNSSLQLFAPSFYYKMQSIIAFWL